MKKVRNLPWNLEAIAWGMLLIWLGIWWGIADRLLPAGAGAVGVGVILLGVNAVRWGHGLPPRPFSLTVGALALVLGGLALAGALLTLQPLEVPVLAIVAVGLGVALLARARHP